MRNHEVMCVILYLLKLTGFIVISHFIKCATGVKDSRSEADKSLTAQ